MTLQGVLMVVLLGLLALSFLQIYSSQFSALTANRRALQAQQFAQSEADFLRNTSYDELDTTAHARQAIAGTNGWTSEVSLAAETTVNGVQQRLGTIKVYRNSSVSAPDFSLQVPLTSQNSDGLAIGCIVAWAIEGAIPKNYLECNGQVVDSSKYPKLAALMSHTPDYRGMFLRGLGSQSFSQLNGSRNGVTSTVYSSGDIGDIQGDAIRNITGALHMGHLDFYLGNGVFSYQYGNVANYGVAEWSKTVGIYLDASYMVPVADENRPINKAVRYLIKAK